VPVFVSTVSKSGLNGLPSEKAKTSNVAGKCLGRVVCALPLIDQGYDVPVGLIDRVHKTLFCLSKRAVFPSLHEYLLWNDHVFGRVRCPVRQGVREETDEYLTSSPMERRVNLLSGRSYHLPCPRTSKGITSERANKTIPESVLS